MFSVYKNVQVINLVVWWIFPDIQSLKISLMAMNLHTKFWYKTTNLR